MDTPEWLVLGLLASGGVRKALHGKDSERLANTVVFRYPTVGTRQDESRLRVTHEGQRGRL